MSEPLSELIWERVFAIRCKAKQGIALTQGEQDLIERALRSDRKRYAALTTPVFDATAPFGSIRKAKR